MEFGFRDNIAVVTGGNSGIGRSISTKLAEAGATVIMIARDKTKGEATRQQIADIGGRSEFLSVDLRDYGAVQAAMTEIDQKFGALNVLINCAGGSASKLGVDESTSVNERWVRMAGGNLLTTYLATTCGVAIMRRTGGAIVNISSTASQHGNYGLYGAMKAGLEGLTRSMAFEYAPLGIRVNAISPGWIATAANVPDPDNPAEAKWATTASLLGRRGSVEEVAVPTLFLASDHASFITGTTLVVDGGLSIVDATMKETHARAQ